MTSDSDVVDDILPERDDLEYPGPRPLASPSKCPPALTGSSAHRIFTPCVCIRGYPLPESAVFLNPPVEGPPPHTITVQGPDDKPPGESIRVWVSADGLGFDPRVLQYRLRVAGAHHTSYRPVGVKCPKDKTPEPPGRGC